MFEISISKITKLITKLKCTFEIDKIKFKIKMNFV